MTDDAELLRRYADESDETAFADVVRRHIDFVYAAALRQARGNAALAGDVTQMVFTDMARKAAKLARHTVVVGWLHTATRFAATKAIRMESRRYAREKAAHAEADLLQSPFAESAGDAVDWTRVQPVLDDVLGQLKERERAAILLRFFEGRPFVEVGARLALNESAARSCVDRALEKMRTLLARRGIASSNAALGVALANQVSIAAPAGFATAVTSAALAGTAATAAGGGAIAAFGAFFTMSKINVGIASVLVVAGATTAVRDVWASRALRGEIESLQFDRQEDRRVRAENERLITTLAKAGETHPDVGEFARLHSRIAQLKARPDGVTDSGMKPAAAWRNAGRATVADAYETLQWAQSLGDLDVFATFITFVPRSKARLDTFFANLPESARLKYGTPEKMVAASNANASRTDNVAFQIIGQTEYGIKVMVHAWTRDESGRERKNDMLFQLCEDGWRAAPFSDEMTDGIIASLDPATGERISKTK